MNNKLINKTQKIVNEYNIVYGKLFEKKSLNCFDFRQEPEPDPLFHEADLRIRIRSQIKMNRIHNTDLDGYPGFNFINNFSFH